MVKFLCLLTYDIICSSISISISIRFKMNNKILKASLFQAKRIVCFVKKKWLIILILIIVALVMAISPFLLNKNKVSTPVITDQKNAIDDANKISSTIPINPTDDEIESKTNELEVKIDTAENDEVKQVYVNELIEVYINSDKFDLALEAAKSAEKDDPSARNACNIATVYMKMKSYKEAAEYYQLAADRSEKTDNSDLRTPYNEYTQLKKQAEAMNK